MCRTIFLLVAASMALFSCARTQPAPYGPSAPACDDGGEEGGVVIDGVCL